MTLNPMMPKMMMAAKIEVAQFVKATMHASLIMMIMIIVFEVSFKLFVFFSPQAIVGDRIVGAVGNEAAKGEAEGEKNLEM